MSFGIAFEGCAGKAAFHIGVLEYMTEKGIVPDATSGASSGSIPAMVLASGLSDGIRERWLSSMGAKLFDFWRLFRGKWPTLLREFIQSGIAASFGEKRLNELTMPVAIPVTQFGWKGFQRKVYTHKSQHPILEVILATCHLPGFYSRVASLENKLNIDGAWQIRTPVTDLLNLGAQKTIACVTNVHGALYQGFFLGRKMQVPDHCRVLCPTEPIAIGPFDANPKVHNKAIDIGWKSAERFFNENHIWLRN